MLSHYLTVAYRDILRQPFSTAIGLLTLSLGLVAVITAYAIVHYWQHSDGQFQNIDRIYVITASVEFEEGGIRTGTMPQTNIFYARYLETEYPELEAVARAFRSDDVSISTAEHGYRASRLVVDAEFAEIFDLPFVAGDPSTALSRPLSVVLTEPLAASLFGNENPLGKHVTLANQVDATVTGVIRPIGEPSHLEEIEFYTSWDVWGAIQLARRPDLDELPEPVEQWFGGYCCTTYVLLPESGSLTGERLQDQLTQFASRRVSAEELSRFGFEVGAIPLAGLTVTRLDTTLFGPASGFLSITTLLFALGGLILAVACINYANLATARALKRARDVGLRKVVGANRYQLAAQYLLESGLLVGLALGIATLGLLLLMPVLRAGVEIDLSTVPILSTPGFYAFAAALLVLVTLLAGAYPAAVLSGIRPVEALRLGRLRAGPKLVSTLLVGAQFLAASFLLIMLIVMYAQNLELRRSALGASSDPLLIIDNASALTGVSDETLRAELLRLAQIEGVTGAGQPPWGQGVNLNLVSRSADPIAAGLPVFANWVGYDFFSVFDIPVVAGRIFDRQHGEDVAPFAAGDLDPSRPINIVLDRDFTGQLGFESPEAAIDEIVYWPSDDADKPSQQLHIIGVVENRPLHLYGIGVTVNYFGLEDDLEYTIARIDASDVTGALAAIDSTWSRLSPSMPLSRRFLDDVFDESYRTFGRLNELFVSLALMAFFISVVGLLGMAMQVAAHRRHEIGVRKTLGATTPEIVRMLLRYFSKPVVIANLIAWPLGFLAASVYLTVFMHRIPLTPTPFLLSLAITTFIAWLTVAGQALRAARVRPADALSCE